MIIGALESVNVEIVSPYRDMAVIRPSDAQWLLRLASVDVLLNS